MEMNPFKGLGKLVSKSINVTERVPGWISGGTLYMISKTGEGYREARKPVKETTPIVTSEDVQRVKEKLSNSVGDTTQEPTS
jgi:hypothetical protein